MYFRTLMSGIALSMSLTAAVDVQAQVSAGIASRMEQAISAAESRNWGAANSAAQATGERPALDMMTWMRLRAGDGSWPEYVAFLRSHADYPGLSRLRKSGEPLIPANASANDVFAFFGDELPQTGIGSLRYAAALQAAGRGGAEAEIIRAWTEMSMDADEEAVVLASHGRLLSGYHVQRLDMLLWRGQTSGAERMLSRVDAGHRSLGLARIALRREQDGVNGLIDAVPASLQSDPGLAYERFRWRRSKGLDSSRQLMLERSVSAANLGQPERWARARRDDARSAMRTGSVSVAYQLASNHFLTAGSGYDYADLEWLSGFLQLRRLNNPAAALPHFQRFEAVVDTPISLGRAGYWLGRTYEAMGDQNRARAEYAKAAAHQVSFYGQLAAQRIGAQPDPSLTGGFEQRRWQDASFASDPRLRIAQLAFAADDWVNGELFMTRIAIDLVNRSEVSLVAQAAAEFGRPDTGVRVAKRAAQEGLTYPDTAYPVLNIAPSNTSLPSELILSLARQESEMNPQAVSRVGARGLMQVMPATGRDIAREMGVAYDLDRLSNDGAYNARFGTHYLEGLMSDFGGSYILSAVGYNAGPGRSRQWSQRYGDPRSLDVDRAVDWIEHIPFNETRNYVMRVLEGMHVYRNRLNGAPVPLRIEQDVTAG